MGEKMTGKPEVLAAMGKLRSLSKRDGVSEANRECVEIIRAELLAMDARLAEADALLRQATEWNWLDEPVEEMNTLAQKIEDHLSENAMHNSAREVGE